MKLQLLTILILSACTLPTTPPAPSPAPAPSEPSAVSASSAIAEQLPNSSKYLPTTSSCYRQITNRGRVPKGVLDLLTDFARTAPDKLFERNDKADIYSLVASRVGPFTTLKQRRAVMVDVLLVLGGFESSWSFLEGRDPATSASKPCEEFEAGIFQVSSNSFSYSGDLRKLYDVACKDYAKYKSCEGFQRCTKAEPAFAISYTAMLLRLTYKHHGPLIRGDVTRQLSKSCEREIESVL